MVVVRLPPLSFLNTLMLIPTEGKQTSTQEVRAVRVFSPKKKIDESKLLNHVEKLSILKNLWHQCERSSLDCKDLPRPSGSCAQISNDVPHNSIFTAALRIFPGKTI